MRLRKYGRVGTKGLATPQSACCAGKQRRSATLPTSGGSKAVKPGHTTFFGGGGRFLHGMVLWWLAKAVSPPALRDLPPQSKTRRLQAMAAWGVKVPPATNATRFGDFQ